MRRSLARSRALRRISSRVYGALDPFDWRCRERFLDLVTRGPAALEHVIVGNRRVHGAEILIKVVVPATPIRRDTRTFCDAGRLRGPLPKSRPEPESPISTSTSAVRQAAETLCDVAVLIAHGDDFNAVPAPHGGDRAAVARVLDVDPSTFSAEAVVVVVTDDELPVFLDDGSTALALDLLAFLHVLSRFRQLGVGNGRRSGRILLGLLGRRRHGRLALEALALADLRALARLLPQAFVGRVLTGRTFVGGSCRLAPRTERPLPRAGRQAGGASASTGFLCFLPLR